MWKQEASLLNFPAKQENAASLRMEIVLEDARESFDEAKGEAVSSPRIDWLVTLSGARDQPFRTSIAGRQVSAHSKVALLRLDRLSPRGQALKRPLPQVSPR